MTHSEFPKDTNSLLTTEEKSFLDNIPDEGVAMIIRNESDTYKLSFIAKDFSTTMYHEFEGERAAAVRDYYAMLFAYGIRTDPRVL